MSNAYDNAEAGAAVLDREIPGWAERINLDGLDMGIGNPTEVHFETCGCVLAQLYGTYERGRILLGHLDSFQSERLGFVSAFSAEYPALDEAWTKLVKARA